MKLYTDYYKFLSKLYIMIKILIDNGHGVNTKGKQSPDGRLREYAYAREIATRVMTELRGMGYNAERVVEDVAEAA